MDDTTPPACFAPKDLTAALDSVRAETEHYKRFAVEAGEQPVTDHDDAYDLDNVLRDSATGETIGDLVSLVNWADPEPGQTSKHDELRLHLLSEHGLTGALGLADVEVLAVHAEQHAAGRPVGHPTKRITWNEDRIIVLTIEHAGDVTLSSRWQAHYTRVERANGGSLHTRDPLPVPDRDPKIYDAAEVDRAVELAALGVVRERLVAHFAWHPRTALAVADVVDELAREIAFGDEVDDLDDEIGEDEDDG